LIDLDDNQYFNETRVGDRRIILPLLAHHEQNSSRDSSSIVREVTYSALGKEVALDPSDQVATLSASGAAKWLTETIPKLLKAYSNSPVRTSFIINELIKVLGGSHLRLIRFLPPQQALRTLETLLTGAPLTLQSWKRVTIQKQFVFTASWQYRSILVLTLLLSLGAMMVVMPALLVSKGWHFTVLIYQSLSLLGAWVLLVLGWESLDSDLKRFAPDALALIFLAPLALLAAIILLKDHAEWREVNYAALWFVAFGPFTPSIFYGTNKMLSTFLPPGPLIVVWVMLALAVSGVLYLSYAENKKNTNALRALLR
jgi:hypothetical protein